MGKLKHQRRGRPRRPTDRAKSRVRQRRAAAAAQDKLMRWYRDRSREPSPPAHEDLAGGCAHGTSYRRLGKRLAATVGC